jgi:hypothetical protein
MVEGPSASTYALEFLSADENSLYLATEIGLFPGADGGANWMPPPCALPR